jgi:hypothetical protein
MLLFAPTWSILRFARIGIIRALNRHHLREFDLDRKPHHWGNESSRGTARFFLGRSMELEFLHKEQSVSLREKYTLGRMTRNIFRLCDFSACGA